MCLVEELKGDSTIQIGKKTITFTAKIPDHLRYLPAVQSELVRERSSAHVSVRYTEVPDTPIGMFFFCVQIM